MPLPSATDGDRHTNFNNAAKHCGGVDVDREDLELQRLVCELYHVDYECFAYELPPACATHHGDTPVDIGRTVERRR